MKKYLLVAILVLALCLSAALAEDDIVGRWELAGMIYNGETYYASDTGQYAAMEFKSDHTGVYSDDESVVGGEWNREGDLYLFEGMELAYENDMLLLNAGEVIMVFCRWDKEPEARRPVPAENEEAFFGTWTADLNDKGSEDKKPHDIQFTVVVRAGNARVDIIAGGVLKVAEDCATSFQDGVLRLSLSASEKMGFSIFPLMKTAGGGLMAKVTIGEGKDQQSFKLHLEKAPDAEPPPAEGERYHDDVTGITFYYPSGWIPDTDRTEKVTASFIPEERSITSIQYIHYDMFSLMNTETAGEQLNGLSREAVNSAYFTEEYARAILGESNTLFEKKKAGGETVYIFLRKEEIEIFDGLSMEYKTYTAAFLHHGYIHCIVYTTILENDIYYPGFEALVDSIRFE